MTPFEEYKHTLKYIDEITLKQKEAAKLILRDKQKYCEHTFGGLIQIGWVPDVEIMGYVCSRCGYEEREIDRKEREANEKQPLLHKMFKW